MRISRRTSGGRGEYEISEAWEGISSHDLVGHRIILDVGNDLLLDTSTELREQGGKLRLRRLTGTGIQIQRQVAAALLMPHPVRADYSLGTGRPVIKRNQYAVNHLHVTKVSLTPGIATIRLGTMTIRNQMYDAEEVSFDHRMQSLQRLWMDRERLLDDISDLLAQHEMHITVNRSVGTSVEKIVARLEALVSESAQDFDILYSEGTDVLDALMDALNVVRAEPVVQLTEVDPEEPDLRRRVIGEWKRWSSSRGAISAKFRATVRYAYNSTCAVCGKHLPATTKNRLPGVDAAHILPWAEYDLDHISNGICLCKHHHWAFDEGLIRIRFYNGQYHVEVPSDVGELMSRRYPSFSLTSLTECQGQIPVDRLPKDPAARPHRYYLQRRNEELDMA